MKTSKELVNEIETLFSQYEKEVYEKQKQGLMAENTVKTYLQHSGNFVKWIKDEFEPGAKNR